MNSSNTKLKPLDHKKALNNQIPTLPITNSKQVPKKTQNVIAEKKKPAQQQPNPQFQRVKYTRSSNRTTKTVEHYDCDDFDMPKLEEEDSYFQLQLQKNSKVENQSKTQKIVPKNQVVLPKLEGDLSMKQMKDIEREMDLEMSKMFDKQMNEDM